MIPIRLTIEGLYSYKEKQTIDFNPLTSGGIFGIFGPVGSGKSSILEAMMLALYGNIDRLNQKENRGYNLMNLKSDRMLIDFECFAGKGSTDTYKFIYETRRNSKNFEDVRSPVHRILKDDNGSWLPLEGINAEDIIGLNYDHFKKTVIIPQGKFREFIDHTGKQRTDMLQDLFQLGQFDMQEKAGRLSAKTKQELEYNRGLFVNLEAFSKERLAQLIADLENIQEESKSLEHEVGQLEKAISETEELKKLNTLLSAAQTQKARLNSQEEVIKEREENLLLFDKYYRLFGLKLQNHDRIKTELEQQQRSIIDIKEKEIQLKQEHEASQKALQDSTTEWENKHKVEKRLDDLRSILEIQKLSLQAASFKDNLNQSKLRLQNLENQINLDKEATKTLEKAVAVLREKGQELIELNHLRQAYEKKTDLEKSLSQLRAKAADIQAQIKEKASHVIGQFRLLFPDSNTEDLKVILDQVTEEIRSLEETMRDLRQMLEKRRVRSAFSAQAKSLQEGSPCPICGSTHHPHPADGEAISHDIDEIERQVEKIETRRNEVDQFNLLLNRIDADIDHLNKRFSETTQEGIELKAELSNHLQGHDFEKLPYDELLGKIEDTEKSQEQFAKDDQKLRDLKLSLQQNEEEVQKIREEYQQNERKAIQINTIIQERKEQLTVDSADKWMNFSESEISQSIMRGEHKLVELQEKFLQAKTNEEKKRQALDQLGGNLKALQNSSNILQKQFEEAQNEIDHLLQSSDLNDMEEVRKLLDQNINIELERKEIESFKTSLTSVNAELESLKNQIGNREFDEAAYQTSYTSLNEKKARANDLRTSSGALQRDITESEAKLQEKEKLETVIKDQEIRLQNLNDLQKLFRGKGFVEYVSGVYLKNLVNAANARFMKLTRNQLSLELNDKNDFIVRDYLNNGKTRLLKTLSGGQSFQAALCLALSLAENVKSLNMSDQSFFFLDEGFGTLDKNSLRVVFESLKSLREENRIVGIISHVEELQQEIEVHLKVHNDPERGSLIETSW